VRAARDEADARARSALEEIATVQRQLQDAQAQARKAADDLDRAAATAAHLAEAKTSAEAAAAAHHGAAQRCVDLEHEVKRVREDVAWQLKVRQAEEELLNKRMGEVRTLQATQTR